MEMAALVAQYYDKYIGKYGNTALPGHLKTLTAILRCRTPDSGELYIQCPDCDHAEWRPLSCGNRHCPQCQNHNTSQWLDKQQKKLLPVPYFLVTFTLPRELRPLAWFNQKAVYTLLFTCIAGILKDFGVNPKHLGAEIGMTMVLHTNTRSLDYHPHLHVLVPGGGIDRRRRHWKKLKGDYLFNGRALAKVFRARFLEAIREAGLQIPNKIPQKWVAHCVNAGTGIETLKYLSQYLYRGVLGEKNIVSNQNGEITFKYIDSETGETRYRSLPGEDFLHLIVQHVLPKGFRRVRDYGYLHGNAKKLLFLIQLILQVIFEELASRSRPVFKCPRCKAPMLIVEFRKNIKTPG